MSESNEALADTSVGTALKLAYEAAKYYHAWWSNEPGTGAAGAWKAAPAYQALEAHLVRMGAALDSALASSPKGAALPEGVWISVKDRLPEANAVVLLWVKADKEDEDADGNVHLRDVSYVDFGHWQPSYCGGEGYFDNYASNFEDRKVVTHWQPLPSAPQESA